MACESGQSTICYLIPPMRWFFLAHLNFLCIMEKTLVPYEVPLARIGDPKDLAGQLHVGCRKLLYKHNPEP